MSEHEPKQTSEASTQNDDNEKRLAEYMRLREVGVPIPLSWIKAVSPVPNSSNEF